MKPYQTFHIPLALLCLAGSLQAADLFVSPSGNNVPPYASWADAANVIQDAIDAATAGDVVWVTNGVYTTGGRAMAGDLVSRVALNKAITVQSVNGPFMTVIQGTWDPAINGPQAVRCAWLTNGALLCGFTLTGGATRTTAVSGDTRGGGVSCSSSAATVVNCLIISNSAFGSGAGADHGTLNNCLIMGNRGPSIMPVAGAYACALRNCTVISNSAYGTYTGTATNCIVFFNSAINSSGTVFSYSCTTPLPSGSGNISVNPGLASDGFHLTASSPCAEAGTNLVTGTDIDGTPWSNLPPIGCDQWQALPVVDGPILELRTASAPFSLRVFVQGQDPLDYQWYQNGLPLADDSHFSGAHGSILSVNDINASDAAVYQVTVSNTVGVITSGVSQVVIHFVNASSTNAFSPFESWATAATNIQDAIDAALPGEIVLVTNGTYSTGGKIMSGDLVNRVAIDKPILVQSVNGSAATTIQGAWDSQSGTGPLAVRAAWLSDRAVLSGFTITRGATRSSAYPNTPEQKGAGAFGPPSALVANCLINSNIAALIGGGAFGVTLQNCALSGNTCFGGNNLGDGGGAAYCNLSGCVLRENYAAYSGGGAVSCHLWNCALLNNSAGYDGGGARLGTLVNCALTGNKAGIAELGYGGGAYRAQLTNCILFGNILQIFVSWAGTNYDSCVLSNCCSLPLPAGAGNIGVDPQLLADGIHLSASSPCRGAALSRVLVGMDIDGQPWASPPSIGCDEWHPDPVIVSPLRQQVFGRPLALQFGPALVAGQDPFGFVWLKDGAVIESSPHYGPTDASSLVISNFGPADVGSYQVVASTAFGMFTSVVSRVVVHCVDLASSSPSAPYSDWSTAAATIQDGIDAAGAGEFVLVTNGIYSTGGRVMAGDLTNRVVITNCAIVAGINGAPLTVVQGAWDPVSTNGPLATRCAWLGDGALLSGFTLTGGATRMNGDNFALQSGGGVWALSTNASVVDCVISNNGATYGGGGTYQGQFNRCLIAANRCAYNGGGAYQSRIVNSAVTGNWTLYYGGGTYGGTLLNATVSQNSTRGPGGGIYNSSARNCIVAGNNGPSGVWTEWYANVPDFAYTCTSPLPSGPGNITSDPQLSDGMHLLSTSPCVGAGSPLYSSGTDIDGEAWLNPPSMGCDEFYLADCTGPLSVTLRPWFTSVAEGAALHFDAQIRGRASRATWSFGDGTAVLNGGVSRFYSWTNPGDYTVTFTVYNVDNPGGVSTNLLIHVLPRVPPTLTLVITNGGVLFVSCPTIPGLWYIAQQATNLVPPISWQTIGQMYSTGDPLQFTDPATNGSRFFRVYMH